MNNDWMVQGVHVNAIAPGYLATDMTLLLFDESNSRYQKSQNGFLLRDGERI